MPDPRFPLIRVSQDADCLIEEYTEDVTRHAIAPHDIADHTYGIMTDSRRRLYEYIMQLESRLDIPSHITRRF